MSTERRAPRNHAVETPPHTCAYFQKRLQAACTMVSNFGVPLFFVTTTMDDVRQAPCHDFFHERDVTHNKQT